MQNCTFKYINKKYILFFRINKNSPCSRIKKIKFMCKTSANRVYSQKLNKLKQLTKIDLLSIFFCTQNMKV